jgi:hypothetical protein
VSTSRRHIVWRVGSITRHTLVILALLVAFPNSHSATTNRTQLAQSYFPEVRLRKLHLVRPDLIPYPIFYEVYC